MEEEKVENAALTKDINKKFPENNEEELARRKFPNAAETISTPKLQSSFSQKLPTEHIASTAKFPVLENTASDIDFRPRSSSARLIPRHRMESINENESQAFQYQSSSPQTPIPQISLTRPPFNPSSSIPLSSTPPSLTSNRRKSSLIEEIDNINEIVSNLQQRRKSLQIMLKDRKDILTSTTFRERPYRRSISHVPIITYESSTSPNNSDFSKFNRKLSQTSQTSQTSDFTPEMLKNLTGKRRRSMQRLMDHFPSETSLKVDSINNFRGRAKSLLDPRRLIGSKPFDEHRRSSLQNSAGILDNSLERVFDLKKRRRSSQMSNLEENRTKSSLLSLANSRKDEYKSKQTLNENGNIETTENYLEDFKSKSPNLVEIKIVQVQVDKTGEPETPLIPPNDNNIPLQLQHSNTTNNNNNNINNNNLLQNNNRKSISNLSVRRRSSISHQDGGTTITQSTTYVSPDNKFYEETVETFHIVDEESSSSKSSSSTNINNNKMAPKVDAVSKITGQWGKWQLRTVLLIFLCKIPSSWFMACIIFTAPAPRHGEFYCKPPETIESTNHTQWIKISHPEKEEADDHEFNIDFCNVYQDARAHAHEYFHYDSETMEPKPWEKPEKNGAVIPCNSFEHKADYHSLITQFDLVCSRDILVAVTQFFHLFGVLTGGMLATHLLKHFSPKSIMLFGMLTQIFCGNMTGHVVSYELHVFFRCLSAVCCAQMYTAGAMIFTDITGGKYRTTCVCLFEQFWSIGVILLPAVSSFFKSWTHIYMAISFPTIILVYLWKWIPDSPRWLLQRGRLHEAREILIQCIEINGTQDSLPLDIDHQLKQQSIDLINAPPPAGWWTIWKGERAVLHMICVHLAWSIYIVIYYGMLLNIRAFSREHLEVNTVIAGCSEIIGTFIGLYLILNTSIKWQATGIFNIIAGCIAYLAWIIPPEIKGNNRVALLMLSAMISKIAISCTLSILTTCTVELVSDEKKKICAYSTIVWARIWLLTAPFVGATIIFGQLIPQTCFASLAIVGGILTTCINSPRTIPQSSPQTKVPNTKLNSNLPPELMPGIWTIKHHDEKYRI